MAGLARRLFSITLAIRIITLPTFAQSTRPAFEVASIKPNTSGSGSSRSGTRDGGYFFATNVSLKSLILQAYGLQDFQVSGGPDWIDSDRFDIEARAEAGAVIQDEPPDSGRPSTFALMLQSLLEERSQLKLRRETRDLPAYLLVVGRDGSKLKATVKGQPGPGGLTFGSARTSGAGRNGLSMSGSGMSAAALARMLGQQLRRTVIDRTNLEGMFDFALTWTPQSPATVLGPGGDVPPAADPSGPSIFTAVQEQLGLRLESTRAPAEVLIIDSVQRPSEN
jgi:uncharacterized protein (TIGR03435 family)